MSDQQLATRLRTLLKDYQITKEQIDKTIKSGVADASVGAGYLRQIPLIHKGAAAFAEKLHDALLALGATWNGTTYDLKPLRLTKVPLLVAEDLNAIHANARKNSFDATKALTNLLRIIKTAES